MFSVGEILQKTRLKKNITLEQIEKNIKIRQKFLKAIEENKWDFSSKVYLKGIIKNYADYLGLDSKKILAFFRRDYEKKDEVDFKRKVQSNYLIPESQKWLKFGFVLLILILVVYFGYQLKIYLSPPRVTILSPKIEKLINKDKIKIIGKTELDAAVNIFGQRVYQDETGIFEYVFPLKQGKNELIIEVIGANGKKTKLIKNYYLEK